jgi:hypothetical protein
MAFAHPGVHPATLRGEERPAQPALGVAQDARHANDPSGGQLFPVHDGAVVVVLLSTRRIMQPVEDRKKSGARRRRF